MTTMHRTCKASFGTASTGSGSATVVYCSAEPEEPEIVASPLLSSFSASDSETAPATVRAEEEPEHPEAAPKRALILYC